MYKIYVSITTSIILIFIYIFYRSQLLTQIPCDPTIVNSLYRHFVHIDLSHIVSNIFALIVLSKIENKIGSKKFFILLILLIILNTIFDYIFRIIVKNSKCSIGFSGILFGLLSYSLITNSNNGKINLQIIALIIILTIEPSMKSKNVSLVGHSIGAISGIIIALFYK